MAAIVPPARGLGEQPVEERSAGWRKLVQRQARPARFGHHGHQSGPRRRLEDTVLRSNLRGQRRESGELGRGGELVERDLFLAAPAVGQAKR